jgi:hypothetical protein
MRRAACQNANSATAITTNPPTKSCRSHVAVGDRDEFLRADAPASGPPSETASSCLPKTLTQERKVSVSRKPFRNLNLTTFLVRRKPLSAGAVCTRIKGGDFVTNRAHEYRRRAEQCLQTAVTFHNHQARDTLFHMAHVWLRLADNYDDFILPAAIEQPRPVSAAATADSAQE